MDKQEFIKKIAGYVKKYASDYGIAVHSPIIAQAILESGWGESRLGHMSHADTYHVTKSIEYELLFWEWEQTQNGIMLPT